MEKRGVRLIINILKRHIKLTNKTINFVKVNQVMFALVLYLAFLLLSKPFISPPMKQEDFLKFLKNGFSFEEPCQFVSKEKGFSEWSVKETDTFYGMVLGNKNDFFAISCFGKQGNSATAIDLNDKIRKMNEKNNKNETRNRLSRT